MTAIEKWLECLKHLGQTGIPGKCPFCSSKDTDFSITENGDSGYGDIWCNNCKHALHISRLGLVDPRFKHKEVPRNLIY